MERAAIDENPNEKERDRDVCDGSDSCATAPPIRFDTYQALSAPDDDFTGAAFHPDGGLWVAQGSELKRYDYDTNTVLERVTLSGVAGRVYGLGFAPDGSGVWLVTNADQLYLVDWATRSAIASFDLLARGIQDGRAVDYVGGELYVLDGFSMAGDPREHAITVFDVGCEP